MVSDQQTLSFDIERDPEGEVRRALVEVAQARLELVAARTRYREAVLAADEVGIPRQRIAKVAGVTEPAIRAQIKRSR